MKHSQTRIYQRSLELIRLSRQVSESMPRGFAFLNDQLRRASSSVLLNYSEGFGRRGAKDRRHFFQMARGSALEVAAIFDVALCHGAITDLLHEHGTDLCDHLSAMLFRFR
jgi:four helix bundle protein